MSPLGLLGGTFDPIHIGHLRIAIETRERLALAQVNLLPAADPPLKNAPAVSAAHRLAMVERAVAGVAGLGVDARELSRTGVSYTVDTLLSLREEQGPDRPLVFIVGQDVLPTLDRWSRWKSLLELCHVAILVRPPLELAETRVPLPTVVAQWLAAHERPSAAIAEAPAGSVVRLSQPPLAVSSTEVRAALQAGRSAQFLLPQPVIEYIRAHDLYGASTAPHDTE